MNRAPVILGATALGLGATLGFHAHAPAAAPAATAAATTTASPASSSSATKTVTSPAVANQYGNVQLKVTISAGRISAIEAVQLPENDPKSASINAYAEPVLRQSALSAQSASIDVVSGATYTSDGYRTALQAALDQAGFQA